ncbi:hypothetical protein [Amycolatopsis sp. lyj-84]|uniref:hypothetical protein n=1 Tax=Amycolatopsis sp. lyj-84 TaxID=2789284 RepID=UPI003979067C
MRVGRLLARSLVLVSGMVAATAVAWIAGDVAAKADTLVIDGSSGPAIAVEMSPATAIANRTLPVAVVPSLIQKPNSAEALIGHGAVSSKYLDEAVKSEVRVANAPIEADRRAATTVDVAGQGPPGEASRDRVGGLASDDDAPASEPDIVSSARSEADHVTTLLPSPRGHKVVSHQPSRASHPRVSGHAAGKPIPLWSPMTACGKRTNLAAAGAGDHGSGALMSGSAAQNDRIPLSGSDFENRSPQAAVIQPGVRPG